MSDGVPHMFLLQQPAWLWLLVLVLPVALLGWWAFATVSPVRRAIAIVLRAGLIASLVALLAGLSSSRTTSKLTVIAVVDTSGSTQRFYRPPALDDPSREPLRDASDMARWYFSQALGHTPQAASQRGGNARDQNLSGLVVFQGRGVAVAAPGVGDITQRSMAIEPSPGTNIADALRVAASMVPPDSSARLVLMSDGNATAGDALGVAAELGAGSTTTRSGGRLGKIPIDVVPLEYRLDQEVIVESVDAPPQAVSQATVNVRVVLWASAASQGTLQLTRDGTPMDLNGPREGSGRRVSLAPGRNIELIEVALPPGRVHRFRAVYEPDVLASDAGQTAFSGDSVLENNQAEAFTISPGRGSVLLVDGVSQGRDDGAGSTLAGVLRRAGIEVTVLSPASMPTDLLGLEAFDMVLLENVPAEAVTLETQEQLITYVRDMGGGLCMIGGPNSFGAGGWIGSPLASVLPVDLELPDRIVAPEVATLFIIDNSGSMQRNVLGSPKSQQEIANDAAALAIASLDRNDLVGVITFNSAADVLVPMGRNTDAKRTIDRVRSVNSGGGTDLAGAMELGISQLRDIDAKTRHVVILTDGKSQRQEELPALATTLRDMNVKITTIAVGDDADPEMLRRIAVIGGGAAYSANNPLALPQIFLKAVRVVRSPMVREADFTPVVLSSGSGMTSGLGDVPPLGGLVLTRPRQDPTISLAMAAPSGEPVMAHWSVGLGQVVAFTSDAHAWASRWLEWPGYERFWTQLVRVASRPPLGGNVRASITQRSGQLTIRAEAFDADGAPALGLSMPATVYTPGGGSREVNLVATGPGTYEAALLAEETGSYITLIKPSDAGGTRLIPVLAGSTVQEGAEYRTLSSNIDVLRQVASFSGGRVLDPRSPQSANLFDRSAIAPSVAIQRLWQQCLVLAIVLLVLDIANRRIAWDRMTSSAFAGRLAQSAGNAQASLSQLRRAAESVAQGTGRTEPSLALGDAQAQELIRAARDKRREAKLRGVASQTPAPQRSSTEQAPQPPGATVVDASSRTPDAANGASETGLRAAKKRAAQRFEDEA